MTFTGGGFTPNADIGLLFAANGVLGNYDATSDAAGAFKASVNAPTLDQFEAEPPRFRLGVTANDQSKFGPDGPIGPPEESFAPTDVTISDWDADVAAWNTKGAASSKRGKRVQIRAIGWTTAGTTLYIHYLRGAKAVFSGKVGTLTGSCGDLTKKIKTFSFKGAKPGNYAIRFSTSPKWNRNDRWTGYKAVRLK